MRIITGSARGVRLLSPEGDSTRPTSERVKEAIFSALQFELAGRRVLDLFAGSGQLGLEALSRGAETAVFVDASPEALAVCRENARRTRLTDRCRFQPADYRNYLRKATRACPADATPQSGLFDLIFIDPPYATGAVPDALRRICEEGLAAPGCLIVCEGGEPLDPDTLPPGLTLRRAARYSISYVTLLERSAT